MVAAASRVHRQVGTCVAASLTRPTCLIPPYTEGHIDIVQFFVERCHASVHQVNGENATPLMLAITSGKAPLVDYFLRRGALPNEQQDEGLTALHLATIMKSVEMIRVEWRGEGASLLKGCYSWFPKYVESSSSWC